MEDHRREHQRAGRPQSDGRIAKQAPVAVDGSRPLEEQHHAHKVLDAEAEQDEPRDRHLHLQTDGGTKERPKRCHGIFS
jgi:hypothetical protein